MKSEDAALLVNSAFSLVELIIKMRQQSPEQFANQQEKVLALTEKMRELEEKPADYMQTWDGE